MRWITSGGSLPLTVTVPWRRVGERLWLPRRPSGVAVGDGGGSGSGAGDAIGSGVGGDDGGDGSGDDADGGDDGAGTMIAAGGGSLTHATTVANAPAQRFMATSVL